MRIYNTLTLKFAGLCLMILVASCSGSKSNDELAADSLSIDSTSLTAGDQADVKPIALGEYKPNADAQNSTTWDDSLKKYFEPAQIVIVKNAVAEYKDIKSASDFARYYLKTSEGILTLVQERIGVTDPDIYSGDDAPKAHWAWFEQYYPAIYFSVDCSECTYGPKHANDQLKVKAAETQGNEDDLFFEVMKFAETNSYQLVGCDFCAADLLGNGRYSDILNALEKASAAQSLFGVQMNRYRDQVFAMMESDHYFNSKTMVLAELDKMLTIKMLTADEQMKVKSLRDRLSSGELKAQFSCGTDNCTWPEY